MQVNYVIIQEYVQLNMCPSYLKAPIYDITFATLFFYFSIIFLIFMKGCKKSQFVIKVSYMHVIYRGMFHVHERGI